MFTHVISRHFALLLLCSVCYASTLLAQDAASIFTSSEPTPLISNVTEDVNLFSGDFETSINLYTLVSRNALAFPIFIYYDSDINEIASAPNKDKQASYTGLGWNMQMPYIAGKLSGQCIGGSCTVNYSDLRYVEQGQSNQLIATGSGNEYKLGDYRYWKITFISEPLGWEILREDGTKYKFGHIRTAAYRFYSCSGQTYLAKYPVDLKPYRWDLTEIEDVFGNKISFQYDDVTENLSDKFVENISLCQPIQTYTNYAAYTKASYLNKIVDNGTGRVVKFSWGDRTDYVDGYSGYHGFVDGSGQSDSFQEFFDKKRLESIKAYDLDPDVYPTIAKVIYDIRFQYEYRTYGGDSKLVLTSIQRYDPNNVISPLPPFSFDYHAQSFPQVNPGGLKKITYPDGGEKVIYYQPKNSVCASEWRVSYIILDDKMGNSHQSDFIWDNAVSFSNGAYCGHAWVEVDLPSINYGKTKYTFQTNEATNLIGALNKVDHYNETGIIKQAITNSWTAINKNNGAYFRELRQVSNVIDNVTTITDYTYNSNNGLVQVMTETNNDLTVRKTLYTYAFENYGGMNTKHMLTQVVQQATYLNSSLSTNARFSTTTTWREWPTSSGKWAAEANYNWLEDDASYDMPIFNFSTPPGDAEWIKTSRVISRDSYGQAIEAEDANGTPVTTKLGYNWTAPFATISNALNATTFVEDFEDANIDDGIPLDWYAAGASGSYWTTTSGALHWTDVSATNEGQCSNPNAMGSTNYIAEFDVRMVDGNTSGDWGAFHFRKNNSTDTPWSSGYIVYITESGNVSLYNNIDGVIGASCQMTNSALDWHHVRVVANGTSIKIYLDGLLINDVTNSRFSGSYIGFYAFRAAVQFDNIRIYPTDAFCQSQSYDPKTLRVTRQIDANGTSSFYSYDGFGRVIGIKNEDRAVLSAPTISDHAFVSSEPQFIENASFPNGNFAPNWSFEAGLSKWEPYFSGQLTWENNNVVQSQFGDYSLKIVDNSGSSQTFDGACFTYYNGENGTSNDDEYHRLLNRPVIFSAWVRSWNTPKDVRIGIEGNASQVYSVNSTWQRIRVSIPNLTYHEPTPASNYAKRVRCFVYLDGTQTGTIYVDGAALEISNGTTPENILVSTSFFDGLGRKIQSQVRNGGNDIISKVAYNAIGLTDKLYKPQEVSNVGHTYYANLSGLFEQFEYFDDPIARVKKQTHMGGGSWVSYNYGSEAFSTDPNSYNFRYTQITDEETNPGAKITKRFFDRWGRAIGGLDSEGSPDQIKVVNDYDILDNVYAAKPPNYWGAPPPHSSSKTDWDLTYAYDTFGRLVKKDSPDEGVMKSKHDNNGNIRYSQNADQYDGSRFDFTVFYYDNLNRVTHIGEEYNNFNWDTASPDITNTTYGKEPNEWKIKYYYDLSYVANTPNYCLGRLTKTEVNEDTDDTPEHTTLYVYDRFGNLTEKRITIDGGNPITEKVIRHGYDMLGRETQLTYPSGNVIARQYDAVGRLKKVYTIQ